MKKVLSVIALAARPTIYKVLAITAAAATLAGFLMVWLPVMEKDGMVGDVGVTIPYAMEEIPSKSLATVVCLAGFLAILAVMSLNGCDFGARSDYTVGRLRLDEWKANLLWASYYTVCILIYWAAMAAVCYWAIGRREYGFTTGPQSRLLAFYTSPFLHHLLPLGDTVVWVEDVLLAAMCGGAAMEFSRQQRKGKISGASIVAAAVWTVSSFFAPMGNWINYVIPFIPIAFLIIAVMKEGDEADEKPVSDVA